MGTETAENRKPIDLVDAVSTFYDDPLGYVYFAFPWGQGQLLGEDGPDTWQREILELIGSTLREQGDVRSAIQIAVSSGHEIGKTALISWIILWWYSTRPHPAGVTTANTGTQLTTKTWRELAKWKGLAINGDWFEWTATKFYLKQHPDTWFDAAIPWSKERSEAFAGTHEKYVLMIFDEASIIDDVIWEVTEGALSENSLFLAFGNPTRNTGRFRQCFPGGKFSHRWITRKIDSRNAKKANQARIKGWIEDYGEDSDFVRIRVKGEFPRASSTQFIPEDLVLQAVAREVIPMSMNYAPMIIGVDVARFGDDQTVIFVRQGHYIHEIRKLREKDTMQVAGYVAETMIKYKPDATFVDVVGIGAGVVDRLRQLQYSVTEINGGTTAHDEKLYFNLRAEMWGRMREWLKTACLPNDPELISDLIGPEYGFDNKNRIQLEKKEDMKARGLSSPDVAEALGMTLAEFVAPQDLRGLREPVVETSFDVFTYNQ